MGFPSPHSGVIDLMATPAASPPASDVYPRHPAIPASSRRSQRPNIRNEVGETVRSADLVASNKTE
jgi:hypothetical protein